jgi:hypothetical protein
MATKAAKKRRQLTLRRKTLVYELVEQGTPRGVAESMARAKHPGKKPRKSRKGR